MTMPNWNWRPDSLDAFIGQESLKKWLKMEIPAAMAQNRPVGNMLLSGPPGLGKTSLSHCLARARGVNSIVLMGPNISMQTIGRVFGAIANVPDHEQVSDAGWARRDYNGPEGRRLADFVQTGEPTSPTIVVCDEADGMDAAIWETVHKLLEPDSTGHRNFWMSPPGSGTAQLHWVPPFTWISLTNHPDQIPGAAKRAGRCPMVYEFEPYTVDQIIKVVEQFSAAVKIKITTDAVREIAERCNGQPASAKDYFVNARSALDMLRMEQKSKQDVIDKDVLEIAFQAIGIDKLGLRADHRSYLKSLANSTSGVVPLPTLAAILNKSTRSITTELEPILIRRGLVYILSKGRQITPAGRAHITPAGEQTTSGTRLRRTYP